MQSCERQRARQGAAPDTLNIVIHHDMGQKWSFYYKGMFSAALEDLLSKAYSVAFSTGNSSALTITNVNVCD